MNQTLPNDQVKTRAPAPQCAPNSPQPRAQLLRAEALTAPFRLKPPPPCPPARPLSALTLPCAPSPEPLALPCTSQGASQSIQSQPGSPSSQHPREPPEHLPGYSFLLWAPTATRINVMTHVTAVTPGQEAPWGQEPQLPYHCVQHCAELGIQKPTVSAHRMSEKMN